MVVIFIFPYFRGRRLQLDYSGNVAEQGSSRAIRAVLRNRAETRTPKVASPPKKCKSGIGCKRISTDKQTDSDSKEILKDKLKSPPGVNNDDQASTSKDTASNTFGHISKSFLTPGPSADSTLHEEEDLLEEEDESKSIQGEISDTSDIEDLDQELEENDSHENMSDVSDTVYSLSGQRSRIPVPISGSLTAHNLVSIDFFTFDCS